MRGSDLLLAENLMDMRCGELRHAARPSALGSGASARSRLLVAAGASLVSMGSWLQSVGFERPREAEDRCQGCTGEPRPATR
jgi:hypothetical protein